MIREFQHEKDMMKKEKSDLKEKYEKMIEDLKMVHSL